MMKLMSCGDTIASYSDEELLAIINSIPDPSGRTLVVRFWHQRMEPDAHGSDFWWVGICEGEGRCGMLFRHTRKEAEALGGSVLARFHKLGRKHSMDLRVVLVNS